MKTEDFSSCCADTTFANKMTIASPFSSLEHAITVARDIWSRKLNVRSWLEALSGRSCSNEYLEMANASTVQKLHEWGIKVRGEIWLCFVTFVGGRTFEDILAELKMRFNNSHGVELEIASKEELKYIECAIRELLSKKSVQTIDKGDGEIVADTLDGADTDSEDDLDAISSGGYDISRDVELNRVPKKDNKL
ncbi:uric acid degradation bifunctional protein TTL-like isoform X2 [Arachis stenosperma]|uniref:uric acid degradation bifunctional protein TTL-like isoform X2 n=1 Tax=Arachis stenosperma TaxID=217475 RepID=UPI0025AC6811|nr:uric acid degradation bifunctional protein TTL-like isoform X2 [Arachis stenosperma]